jgi:RimJ/RimL family protein N-acetyltransferase
MGGPDMAPQPPQRSGHPGEAVAPLDSGYPKHLEREIALADGARVVLRPIRPDDESLLVDLYDRLSRDSRYQRFFSVMRRLPPDWAHFLANVDYRRRFAYVLELRGPAPPRIIGVGRYEPTDADGVAEVAFVVQDEWQGRGLGTLLFNELLAAAAANGIRRFRAWVLGENRRMLGLISHLADITSRRIDAGVYELDFAARSKGPID